MESEGYPSFQKSPVRGRPNVSKLVPKKLTRTTTDDTQTAINRVVHEALARGGTVSSPEVAEEVKQRVAVVLQAKEDELTGKITHQQRLQLIKLVATLSVEEAMEEARRLQSSTREDAEQKVKSTSMLPLIWRRMLCGYFLSQDEVLVLGACCRFLRQDHALGLQCFMLPSHLESLEDTVCTAPLAAKPMPLPALKRLVFKFRYSQKLVASTRGFRFQNSELELLPLAQLRVLDLSFCYTLSEEALLAGLRSTLCLSELSLRGCSQLTSPTTEETLSELKGLVQLDVRGCSSLNSDSILLAAADALKQLTTLRLGYTCKDELWPEHQVMPLETFSSAAFAQLGASHSRLQHLELDIGLMFRWTERDGASVVDDAVKSLMSLKHLEALLLWNCVGLQMNTFRCILDRLEGEGIDTVGIDDCYHDFDAYFHVVPSAWGIRTQRDLQKGVNSEAMLPPGRTGGRAVLIGHNICRNREELLQNTVSPLLRKSKPRQLVLQCEADTNEIFELASDRLEELEILTSCNAPEDYLGVFVCSMLRRCPQLKRLKICTQGAHMSRQNLHGYEEMLKVLAGGCPQLEILDVRLATTFSDIRGRIETFSVEYYDDDQTRVAPGALQCHYDTLRDLFRSCPLLATLHLLPPAKEDRVAFWKFCCEAGFY
ncbi:unnamed protein product [Symbiodinium natans]|uniref:Uncharacterized protein n=1 Tax=Symbiodinium natans TaxID=878477 RepID=A0A812J7L1_9DINO|nr:unnamed protein product [Symbiodinium natans]